MCRRKCARPPYERCDQVGDMVQIDGSPHDWFEGCADRCALIVFIDDAASWFMAPHLTKVETTEAYMEA